MRIARAHLAAPLLLAGLIAACSSSSSDRIPSSDADVADASGSQDAGLEDAATDAVGDSAPTCALPGKYGSTECMACVSAKCCEQITTCQNDTHCQPLQRCVLDCLPKPDAGGCLDDCLATFPDGVPLWDEVDHCWFGTPPGGCLVECTN